MGESITVDLNKLDQAIYEAETAYWAASAGTAEAIETQNKWLLLKDVRAGLLLYGDLISK